MVMCIRAKLLCHALAKPSSNFQSNFLFDCFKLPLYITFHSSAIAAAGAAVAASAAVAAVALCL